MPRFTIRFLDNHLSFQVGRLGFTVGPRFLSIDIDGDIAHQLISPRSNVTFAPISDLEFEYDSLRGLNYNIPATRLSPQISFPERHSTHAEVSDNPRQVVNFIPTAQAHRPMGAFDDEVPACRTRSGR